MRGLSAAERRSEQLRSWTFLGLVADDVALATLRYPTLGVDERQALESLLGMMTADDAGAERRPVIPRRRSMSDPAIILHEAAALAQSARLASPSMSSDELDFIREPIREMLNASATEQQIEIVQQFAELLARITLTMTEQLANEKGVAEWTPRASDFSLA